MDRPGRDGQSACGSSGDGSTGASAEALAKVRAADYARAVDLTHPMSPDFESIPTRTKTAEAEKRDRELMTCVGVEEEPDPLAEVNRPICTDAPGELLRVGSTVEVGADARAGHAGIQAHRSRRAERCLRRVYASAIEEEESSTAEVSDVSLSRVRFPAPRR